MTLLDYTLIRSKRKSLSLQIKRDGTILVRAPIKMSEGLIRSFIERKKGWIEKHQEKIKGQEGKVKNKEYTVHEIQDMKTRLGDYIIPRTLELWKRKKLPEITGIKITKSEGRWGSCSGRNSICFSYRLAEYIDTPESEFIDAIIIHELAHLREKNHQKPFWNLVYEMMPEYEIIMKKYRGSVG